MNEPGSAMKHTLLSHSAFIFAIRFFPIAALAATGIAFSHLVPPAVTGVYAKLWVYLAVFVAIACLGMPALMLTHTKDSIDGWVRHLRVHNIGLFGIWLLVLAAVLIALFASQDTFGAWVVAALFVMQVWVLLLETYLIIHQRFVLTLAASLLFALSFCVAHYLFLKSFCTLTVMFWVIAMLGSIRGVFLTAIAVAQFKRMEAIESNGPMPAAIKKQWTQLGLYDVSQVAFRWIDKVIVSTIIGPALFAVYFNGTQDVPFMATMLSAVGNGLLQQMAVGEKTTEARLKLINLTAALLARIVFPLFFFLFIFRTEFVVFVFSSKYVSSVPLFAISVVALLLRAYNFTSILQHLNQVKTINWGALLDICIAVGLSYPLFLWKGLQGVAFAFMISSFIQAAFYLVKTSQLLHCSILRLIPWKQWLVMLIVFGCAAIGLHEGLVHYFSLKQTLLLGFAGTAAIIGIALAPVVFSRKAHG